MMGRVVVAVTVAMVVIVSVGSSRGNLSPVEKCPPGRRVRTKVGIPVEEGKWW